MNANANKANIKPENEDTVKQGEFVGKGETTTQEKQKVFSRVGGFLKNNWKGITLVAVGMAAGVGVGYASWHKPDEPSPDEPEALLEEMEEQQQQ